MREVVEAGLGGESMVCAVYVGSCIYSLCIVVGRIAIQRMALICDYDTIAVTAYSGMCLG